MTCASLYLGSLVVRIKVFLLKEVITLFRHCHVQDMPPSSNKKYEGHPKNRENFLIMQEFVPFEHGKCNH